MKDENCIFCKLANGDIPTNAIYEDEDFKVILDASPASKGHSLILPKNHFKNVYEIDDETVSKAAVLAKKIAVKMKAALMCDGINILQNNEPASGQTVFHYHVHLVPRYEGDNKEVFLGWKLHENDEATINELLEKLR